MRKSPLAPPKPMPLPPPPPYPQPRHPQGGSVRERNRHVPACCHCPCNPCPGTVPARPGIHHLVPDPERAVDHLVVGCPLRGRGERDRAAPPARPDPAPA